MAERRPSPAEKLAAAKPARKLPAPDGSRSVRKYPWECRVRQRRAKLRLALRDVAGAIGLSVAGLSEIERGTDPMLSTARRLAEFFGTTVERLWPTRR